MQCIRHEFFANVAIRIDKSCADVDERHAGLWVGGKRLIDLNEIATHVVDVLTAREYGHEHDLRVGTLRAECCDHALDASKRF